LPPSSDMIGTTLSHYRILDKLGEGGMGVVYLAQDITLSRNVALKFLPNSIAQDTGALERFITEAQIISTLNHPNISTIYALEEHEQQKFIVLELIEGQTLKQRIQLSPLSKQDALDIAVQAAEGLAYAHQKGVIHRDVKTENIMVTNEGRVKVTDFGLAKLRGVSNLTRTGTTVGTLAYMSPEQVRGEEIDQRSDIFSFGVVLYEVFAGQLPFSGAYEAAVLYQIVNESHKPLREIKYDISGEIERIIDRCLEKDFHTRYQSMNDVLVDLRIAIQPSQERIHIKRSRASDRRLMYWGLGILVLALIGFLTYRFFPFQIESKEDVPSLAILYLKNLGNESDDVYTYGIVQDLIVDVAKAGVVRVSPMKDILNLQHSTISLNQVAHQLRVRYVFDGTFKHEGNLIKISAQIIDTKNGQTIWADRLVTTVLDLSTFQGRLVSVVIQSLDLKPSPTVMKGLTTPKTTNPEAYEYYLRATYSNRTKNTKADIEVARGLFEKAVQLDTLFIHARVGMGYTYEVLGNYEKAIEIYSTAKIIAEREHDSIALANCLIRLGVVHWCISDYDEAKRYYNEGLVIYRNINDNQGEATALANFGALYSDKGETEKALEYYSKSLSIVQRLKDRKEESRIIYNIGVAYQKEENYSKALEYFSRSLEMKMEIEDKRGEGIVTESLGSVYVEIGQLKEAEKLLKSALNIHRAIGNKMFEVSCLESLGELYRNTGSYNIALEFYNQSLSISHTIGDRLWEGITLMKIGEVYNDQQQYTRSIDTLNKAAMIFSTISDSLRYNESQTMIIFAKVSLHRNQQLGSDIENSIVRLEHMALNKQNIKLLVLMSRIYSVMKNPEKENQYITLAHATLMKQASTISPESKQQMYLDNIPENTYIVDRWAKLHVSH